VARHVTAPPGIPPFRKSLAARVRGWKDDASGVEQRLRDLEAVTRAHRRRWVMVGTGFLIGVLGWIAGVVKTRPTTMVLLAGGAAVLNAITGLITERGWYRFWLIYALALLDALLVGVPVGVSVEVAVGVPVRL